VAGLPSRPSRPDVRIHATLHGCTDRTADIVRDHAAVDERIIFNEFPTPASPTTSAPGRRASSLYRLPYDDTQCGAKVIHLRITD
jgi:hypothetical protein